jgi:hypothetical protein
MWPPQNFQQIFAHMTQWSAWYSNELADLQHAYGGGFIQDSTGFFASPSGGFKATIGRTLQRWFVGQPSIGPNRNTKLPVPIGPMLCQATADLLFADPPTFTVMLDSNGSGAPAQTENPTQDRLNELADDSMYATLAQAAELGAALGGSFLRVAWDKSVVADRPFLDTVDADQALPEFRWGRLVAVTFWSVVAKDPAGTKVWRHLERHELGALGNGIILHGLYEGTDDKLGTRVSLTARPETASLAVITDGSLVEGMIDSQSPGLCVEYMPNQGPNRLWRTHPVGRYLGRSSLDGIEHLMDQLSETMSDWMRARRAAKARVWYDKSLLSNPGPGQGAVADLEQEIYTETTMNVQGPNVKMSDKVQVLQPTFNTTEYETTVKMLIENILQLSGFALQTFGMSDYRTQQDTTATEIESRERRTFLTRARLIRTQIPHLSRILGKLLAVDRAIFNTPNVDAPIWVDFPDSVQESNLRLAQTVQTLRAAMAASDDTIVRILHPEWNDDMWDDEVAKLKSEYASPVMDPNSLPAEPPKPGQTDIPGTSASGRS